MLRVVTAFLVLTKTTVAAAATGYAFVDLRDEMSAAESLPEQRAIVQRMREAPRDGIAAGRNVGIMIYELADKPVFNETATISFLEELVATPNTAAVATTAISSLFRGDAFNEVARQTIAAALRVYHLDKGLSDAAISNLQRALTRNTPQAGREHALAILRLRPPARDQRNGFSSAVSNLLHPEITVGEKLVALGILAEAAESGPLPETASEAVYRTATAEPDAAVRVAAWRLVMRQAQDQRESDRASYVHLGGILNRQLLAPLTAATPSFVNADEEARERAVALLNDYWKPDVPPQYVDILIKLVDTMGSPASMARLLELRRINALTDDQLTALTRINAEDPAIAQALETITIPNIEAGSLVGPAELIAHSDDPEQWAQATEQLLAQYPNGKVPATVAEAAYKVMTHHGVYDAAAIDLFVRGDMPFAERETKMLKLGDGTPRSAEQTIQALQRLHGDVSIDFLIRRYLNNESIDQVFRAALLGMLYREVRESGKLDAETTTAVINFARSTDSHLSASIAGVVLKAAGRTVPWAIRVRQKDFQWGLLFVTGLLSLVVGALASIFVLVMVALPGRNSGLSGAQRVAGLALWLILAALFVGAAALSFVLSIGHNSSPPPGQALPYYGATVAVAILLLVLAIALRRKRSATPAVPASMPGPT